MQVTAPGTGVIPDASACGVGAAALEGPPAATLVSPVAPGPAVPPTFGSLVGAPEAGCRPDDAAPDAPADAEVVAVQPPTNDVAQARDSASAAL
ncbi:MAG: hypothetical protein ABIS35_05720 [Terracoccus sp.]